MSDTVFSGLYAVHEIYMTNCFDEELSKLLTGKDIPKATWPSDRRQSSARYLSIGSRNMWFQGCMKELVKRSGIDRLQFLFGESYSHTHKQVTNLDGEAIWEETTAYTVLNPDYDRVITDIESLEQWCLANPDEAADLMGIYTKYLAGAYDSAFFTLEPTNEGLGEGDSPEFVFCVLRTFREVMRFAKFHKCWAIYETPLDFGPPKAL